MFSPRSLKILASLVLVLVVLFIGYLYKQVPQRTKPYEAALKETTVITVSEKEATIRLEKKEDQWRVGLPNQKLFAVDDARLQTILTALKNLQLEDVLSERPEAAGEFDVSPSSGMRVTLLNASNKTLADGIIGKQSPDYSHIYFRFPDSPKVYLARGIFRGELGQPLVEVWRKQALLEFGEKEIVELAITRGAETLSLVRSSDNWTSNGRFIDPLPVFGLLGTLAHLRADTWAVEGAPGVPAVEALKSVVINLKTADKSYTLHIGALDVKGKRYPVSAGPDTGIAWISEQSLKPALLKTSDIKPK